MKLLTISVAAYHVEKYLSETLSSFLIPGVTDRLEVLIINDGSGEGINTIAREYELRYPDIFRLIDKENGGHGSTVNCGVREASGRYFKTVDGDDRVTADGFAELLSFLETADTDLVVTDYVRFDDAGGGKIDEIRHDFPGKECGKVYRFDEVADKVYINMHAAAYRTELLKGLEWQLDEHCFYVDTEYVLFPVPHIETVAFLEKPVYEYRLGLTTQSIDIRNMQKNCAHHEKVLDRLLHFYRETENDVSPQKKEYIARGVARVLASQYKIYLSFPPSREYKSRICKRDIRIREKYPAIYEMNENRAVGILRKSRYLLYSPASAMCRRAYHCTGKKER